MPRNYRKEYLNYHGKHRQKMRRAGRNRARSLMLSRYGPEVLENRDIDHIDKDPQNNSFSNLRIQTIHQNRSNNQPS
jgi:hypothetical protein